MICIQGAFISHLKRKQRAESDRRPRRTLALTTVTSSYIFFTLRKICRNIDLQFSWLRHHLTWKKEGNISLSKKDLLGHGRWQIRQNQAKWRFPLGSFIPKNRGRGWKAYFLFRGNSYSTCAGFGTFDPPPSVSNMTSLLSHKLVYCAHIWATPSHLSCMRTNSLAHCV